MSREERFLIAVHHSLHVFSWMLWQIWSFTSQNTAISSCLKQSTDICGHFRHLGTKRELKKRGLFYEGGKKIGFDGLCVDIQKSKYFNS